MEYKIYKITNKISGKSYVGKTNDIETRMKGHRNSPCCRYLYRAIKKYGWENFEVKILHECTEEEASVLELEFILRENTLVPNGYNLILETNQGRIFHKESREQMAKKLQGFNKNKNRTKTSKYIGVRKGKGRSNFDVRLEKLELKFSKTFKSEIEAAEAYDKLAVSLYGPEAKLNFPEKIEEYKKEDLESYVNSFNNRKPTSSKHKGVSFHKLTQKWYAYYYENKKQIRLGLFNTEQEAINKIKQYNESIKKC